MTHWDILQIAPTSDKKAIKKAYAALLKHNKPDENPGGFSQLHSAYKLCLQEASNQHHQQAPLPQESLTEAAKSNSSSKYTDQEYTALSESPPDPSEHQTEVIKTEAEPPLGETESKSTEEEDRLAYLRSVWPTLEHQVDKAIEAMAQNKDHSLWQFIENHDALYDIDFKAEFSHYLFERLLNFFEANSGKLPNQHQILRYLNQQFHWSDHHQQLEYIYGDQRTSALLHQLSELETAPQTSALKWIVPKIHNGPIQYGNYYGRLGATFLEGIYLIMLCTSFTDNTLEGLGYVLLIQLFLVPILEASPLQGSPGKVLFGLKVTSLKGRRLNFFHAFWRQIMFLTSLAAIKITVWINFFINDGRLLHDRLSYSVVIKR